MNGESLILILPCRDHHPDRGRNTFSFLHRNKELLKSLGLDQPFFQPKTKAEKPKGAQKKRKSAPSGDASLPPRPSKVARTNPEAVLDETTKVEGAPRRSLRNAGKSIDYNAEQQRGTPIPISFKSGVRVTENAGPLGRDGGVRKYDPLVSVWLSVFFLLHTYPEKLLAQSLVLKWVHGGKVGKGVVSIRFTRALHP